MDVAVIGLGYVGCVTAVGLAHAGHKVVALDTDQNRVEQINYGLPPVTEPGLERALWAAVDTGNLRARCGSAAEDAELSLVCVGTPSAVDGAPDPQAIIAVLEAIGRSFRRSRRPQIIAIRSTVLPNLLSARLLPILEDAAGCRQGKELALCANPEFLREGSALADFAQPPFTLIGSWDNDSAAIVAQAFRHVDAPVIHTDPGHAMMVKYACNAFHAAKISFANEIGNLCDVAGLDGRAVMNILKRDTRLNLSPRYLAPGFAYGGSCLPKDMRALLHLGRTEMVATPLLSSIEESNERQFQKGLAMALGSGGRRIALLGLSFKPQSGDLRESPMVRLRDELRRRGMEVRAYDPDLPQTRPGDAPSGDRAPAPYLGYQVSDETLTGDLCALVQWAEVVVLGKRVALNGAGPRLNEKLAVIDLVNVGEPVAQLANYRGICW